MVNQKLLNILSIKLIDCVEKEGKRKLDKEGDCCQRRAGHQLVFVAPAPKADSDAYASK